jgi:hypothetical protein
MVYRSYVSMVIAAGLFACSPDSRDGISRQDPEYMLWLSAKMQEAHIPFKLGADGVLRYPPQYAEQVKQITDWLDKPYVEETFYSQEYKELYLSQLAAAGRKHEFVPGSGENGIRWWPKSPGELQQMHERIAKAYAASHRSPDLPCRKQPTPSNSKCSGPPSAAADHAR